MRSSFGIPEISGNKLCSYYRYPPLICSCVMRVLSSFKPSPSPLHLTWHMFANHHYSLPAAVLRPLCNYTIYQYTASLSTDGKYNHIRNVLGKMLGCVANRGCEAMQTYTVLCNTLKYIPLQLDFIQGHTTARSNIAKVVSSSPYTDDIFRNNDSYLSGPFGCYRLWIFGDKQL